MFWRIKQIVLEGKQKLIFLSLLTLYRRVHQWGWLREIQADRWSLCYLELTTIKRRLRFAQSDSETGGNIFSKRWEGPVFHWKRWNRSPLEKTNLEGRIRWGEKKITRWGKREVQRWFPWKIQGRSSVERFGKHQKKSQGRVSFFFFSSKPYSFHTWINIKHPKILFKYS